MSAVWSLCFIWLFSYVCNCAVDVPGHFYPVRAKRADKMSGTDQTARLNLTVPISVYNDSTDYIWVSDNGYVAFPFPLPHDSFPPNRFKNGLGDHTGYSSLVIAFWADHLLPLGGTVYYYETKKSSIRSRADLDVQQQFGSCAGDFVTKRVTVITWYRVHYAFECVNENPAEYCDCLRKNTREYCDCLREGHSDQFCNKCLSTPIPSFFQEFCECLDEHSLEYCECVSTLPHNVTYCDCLLNNDHHYCDCLMKGGSEHDVKSCACRKKYALEQVQFMCFCMERNDFLEEYCHCLHFEGYDEDGCMCYLSNSAEFCNCYLRYKNEAYCLCMERNDFREEYCHCLHFEGHDEDGCMCYLSNSVEFCDCYLKYKNEAYCRCAVEGKDPDYCLCVMFFYMCFFNDLYLTNRHCECQAKYAHLRKAGISSDLYCWCIGVNGQYYGDCDTHLQDLLDAANAAGLHVRDAEDLERASRQTSSHPGNSYQVVLISDGTRSFAIFNYDTMEFDTADRTAYIGPAFYKGEQTRNYPPQKQYYAEDFNVSPGGCSLNSEYTCRHSLSNAGVPGQWMYMLQPDGVYTPLTCA